MNRFKCPACGGTQYTSTEPGVGPNPPGHREGCRIIWRRLVRRRLKKRHRGGYVLGRTFI
jgi:hypothetical protein